ncbi:MAG: hypothetical protein U9P79_09635 [Candidatus Cloacimonadota bacterium]|nr:hypothetical protein [Candidatus Cloacimonadota bacterium]
MSCKKDEEYILLDMLLYGQTQKIKPFKFFKNKTQNLTDICGKNSLTAN